MIINKTAGLRGDSVPWYFRKAALGPRVGKRPWGALVGILGYPQFDDTVEAVLDQLEKSPLPAYKRPAYPKYN